MKRAAALLFASLAACGGADDGPAQRNESAPTARAAPAPSGDVFASHEPTPDVKGAAEVARAYFGHIAARRYKDAWALRWQDEDGDRAVYDAFAANFGRYDSYNAQVGPPRPAVAADGSVFVDVPVQLYGRLKNGEGFGSAGMVTLRRKAGDPDDGWRIYS